MEDLVNIPKPFLVLQERVERVFNQHVKLEHPSGYWLFLSISPMLMMHHDTLLTIVAGLTLLSGICLSLYFDHGLTGLFGAYALVSTAVHIALAYRPERVRREE